MIPEKEVEGIFVSFLSRMYLWHLWCISGLWLLFRLLSVGTVLVRYHHHRPLIFSQGRSAEEVWWSLCIKQNLLFSIKDFTVWNEYLC